MNIKKEKQERKTKLRHKIPQTCKKDVEKKQKITKGMRFQTKIPLIILFAFLCVTNGQLSCVSSFLGQFHSSFVLGFHSSVESSFAFVFVHLMDGAQKTFPDARSSIYEMEE